MLLVFFSRDAKIIDRECRDVHGCMCACAWACVCRGLKQTAIVIFVCVRNVKSRLDLIMQCVGQSVQFGSSHLQAVGSYCAVCWMLAFGSLC